MITHRDDDINSPSPCGAELDVDRSDLELVAIELQDDAIVLVGLGMNDPSQATTRRSIATINQLEFLSAGSSPKKIFRRGWRRCPRVIGKIFTPEI
jgi:hypothetical protein